MNLINRINNDKDIAIFFKSTLLHPHLNIILLFKLSVALIRRLLIKIFNSLSIKIGYSLTKNKIFYLLKLAKRGKYLINIYNSKAYWTENNFTKDWFSKLPESGWKPIKNNINSKNNWNFRLSGKEISLGSNNKIDWSKNYSDSEDTMSLHRFDWLITLLAFDQKDSLPNQGIVWIEDWIKNKEKVKKEIG